MAQPRGRTRPSEPRARVLSLLALLTACGHDWDDYDPEPSASAATSTSGSAGTGAGGGSSASGVAGNGGDAGASTSAAGGEGSGASSTSSGGSSGDGGSGDPVCGNGVIEGDEECDDQNGAAGDGCLACAVECSGTNHYEHPQTHTCYRLLSRPDYSWSAASDTCGQWGGFLATVTSQEELDFIRQHITVRAWLGGNELAAEGTWGWENGEPWSFTAWNSGEPNNSFGTDDEDCLEYYDNTSDAAPFGFADRGCETLQRGLCERPAPSG